MSDPSFPTHKPTDTPSNVLSRRLRLPYMAKQIKETTSGLLHSYSSHGTDVMENIGVGVVEVYMLIRGGEPCKGSFKRVRFFGGVVF